MDNIGALASSASTRVGHLTKTATSTLASGCLRIAISGLSSVAVSTRSRIKLVVLLVGTN